MKNTRLDRKIDRVKKSQPQPLLFASFEDWELTEIPDIGLSYQDLIKTFDSIDTDKYEEGVSKRLDWIRNKLDELDIKKEWFQCNQGTRRVNENALKKTQFVKASFVDLPERPCVYFIVPVVAENNHSSSVVQQILLAAHLKAGRELLNVHLIFAHADNTDYIADHLLDEFKEDIQFGQIGSAVVIGPMTGMGFVMEGNDTYGESLAQSILRKMEWQETAEFEEVNNLDIQNSFIDHRNSSNYAVQFLGANKPEESDSEFEPDTISVFLFNYAVLMSKLYVEYEIDPEFDH